LDEEELRMQSDFEIDPDLDEPPERGRLDKEEHSVEQELAQAADFEFRDSSLTLAEGP
jgi:hypothetical protein